MGIGTVNRITLVGPLGRDPDIRQSRQGKKIATIHVVTVDPRTKKSLWHRCIAYDEKIADFIERHLRKNSTVFIEGALETRRWLTRDKAETWTAEIVATKLVLLDREERDTERLTEGAEEFEPTPLSIKRSAAKYGDDADTGDAETAGLARFLATPAPANTVDDADQSRL